MNYIITYRLNKDRHQKVEENLDIYSTLNTKLCEHLVAWKNKINDNKCWDTAKRLSNTYEFIFSSGYNKVSVSKKKPLSRSYFKLWEILHDFNIIDRHSSVKTAHIAEGPGGFIECLCDFMNSNDKRANIYGITLKSQDKKIPSWKLPKYLFEKNMINLYDTDEGNIYRMKTIKNFIRFVGENSCELVTSDGGFDFSADFNNQESHSLMLMISEIYISLKLQKKGGSMILKVFDLFATRTIQLIAICSEFYERFVILKPQTSRPANSEKYLLFQNNIDDGSLDSMKSMQILESCIINNDPSFIDGFTRYEDCLISLTKYNMLYTSNQIDFLRETLRVSQISDLSVLTKNKYINKNIDLCKKWCIEYSI